MICRLAGQWARPYVTCRKHQQGCLNSGHRALRVIPGSIDLLSHPHPPSELRVRDGRSGTVRPLYSVTVRGTGLVRHCPPLVSHSSSFGSVTVGQALPTPVLSHSSRYRFVTVGQALPTPCPQSQFEVRARDGRSGTTRPLSVTVRGTGSARHCLPPVLSYSSRYGSVTVGVVMSSVPSSPFTGPRQQNGR